MSALHDSVANGPSFQKLRAHVRMQKWISEAWSSLENLEGVQPLDVAVSVAQKQVSASFWSPASLQLDMKGDPSTDLYQRRPESSPQRLCDSSFSHLVVVGSLLDNVPNMAGLVRTAEALLGSCAEVTLHSEKVLGDPHFLKMSVASEKAGHVVVVPQGPRLVAYLREKRAAGYSVVALEQTSNSEILNAELQLPERLVVLIGNEQEGLPTWIIHSGLVDSFVELPLHGRTGSLNAHVAASILLSRYQLQHLQAKATTPKHAPSA
eukprot:TRINITY_DN13206_c0_g1_i3.p1 TRINITY_DN13206_c0_g1~~TRINITY_DN13206_c0_g1_i3.p1  ORF type:complete len:265 (+),score=34.69 TRINITY_DN13206_c0_g1_i3:301-1095(+)